MHNGVKVLGVLVLGVLTLGLAFLLGMRAQSPVLLGAVRRTNRVVFNPHQMQSAGAPGAYASVVQHTGRTSGRPFQTPVVAVRTDDGFVIALPYGTQSDWLKNVLASGSATIVHDGATYAVERPDVIPMQEGETYFPPDERRSHRLFAVDQCLRLFSSDQTGDA